MMPEQVKNLFVMDNPLQNGVRTGQSLQYNTKCLSTASRNCMFQLVLFWDGPYIQLLGCIPKLSVGWCKIR